VKEELLNHLCELARLKLSKAEEADFAAKFAQVLAFVDEIKALELNAGSVLPLVMKERQETAEDVVCEAESSPELPRDYRVGSIGDLEGGDGA